MAPRRRRCSKSFRPACSPAAGQICWNRFTGPGKIVLQTMYFHMEGGEKKCRTAAFHCRDGDGQLPFPA